MFTYSYYEITKCVKRIALPSPKQHAPLSLLRSILFLFLLLLCGWQNDADSDTTNFFRSIVFHAFILSRARLNKYLSFYKFVFTFHICNMWYGLPTLKILRKHNLFTRIARALIRNLLESNYSWFVNIDWKFCDSIDAYAYISFHTLLLLEK